MKRACSVLFALLCFAGTAAIACADWTPPDLRKTDATRAAVLAAYMRATGVAEPRFADRRETWTYVNGTNRLPVRVAVRGADFRATITAGTAEYAGGRSDGVRWRADANGITHATLSDDQGDAIDRLPQSTFPFAADACELAGESSRFGAAWVLVDRAPRDKPHWFYVDKATGLIAHEVQREGARTIVTSFDRFESAGGMQRARHWTVRDGNATHDLDVTVDGIVPAVLGDADVAIPQGRRTFAALKPPPNGVVLLPAHFLRREIVVDVDVDGKRVPFILDTGTASITIGEALAKRRGWNILLEHATVPRMTTGGLTLADVSTLAIPFGERGILGYDFFAGHVVHIDYEHEIVEVLMPDAARPVFDSGATPVIPAYVDEGIPLVAGAFGPASGDRFALDTGSQRFYVLDPFARRNAAELDAHWTPGMFPGGYGQDEPTYLEGSIFVRARRAALFTLGPYRFADITVGVQGPSSRSDALDMYFDGIVGTDEMHLFEWWFDYDGGRVALRRNGLR